MSKPPSRARRVRGAPLALLAVAGSASVGWPAAASVTPERAALQARVAAVRAGLSEAGQGAVEPAAGWLIAQATTWTNWPKWSKWSNWANK